MIMSTRPQTAQEGMLSWLLAGRGLGGPAAGYATFQDYNSAVCLPLSAAVKCPAPFDPICVGPAQAAVLACQEAWHTDPTGCGVLVCDASGNPVSSQPSLSTAPLNLVSPVFHPGGSTVGRDPLVSPRPNRPPPPAPAPVYNPQLSFTTSRGGTALQVGDSWEISITGAPPNTPVSVTGGKTGVQTTTVMGTTDGSGNFSISGTFTPDQVATWSEVWQVGGLRVGSLIAFTVSPPPNPAAPPPSSPPPAVPASSSGGGGGASLDFGPLSVPLSQLSNTVQIGSWNIPYWGLGLGAAGLLFLIVRSATK